MRLVRSIAHGALVVAGVALGAEAVGEKVDPVRLRVISGMPVTYLRHGMHGEASNPIVRGADVPAISVPGVARTPEGHIVLVPGRL